MGETKDKKTKAPERPLLKPYHPPHLMVYGVLRELTTGGSGNSGENIASKNKNKRP